MTKFTIETTYRLPVFRQRTYEAGSLEEACRLAVEDDDWSEQKDDYDCSGATFVSGAWDGEDTAYRVPALTVPSQFLESLQRRADQFELMLGMLKVLAHTDDLQAPNLPAWLPRARATIAKAEAVMEGAPDPDPDATDGSGAAYVVLALSVSRVREQLVSILETDPALASLTADGVSDREICDACVIVSSRMELQEQIGAAEFRAALMAIGGAGRRLAADNRGGTGDA
jgi:hypothetical protein